MSHIPDNKAAKYLLLWLGDEDLVINLQNLHPDPIANMRQAVDRALSWITAEGEHSGRPYFHIGTRVVRVAEHVEIDSAKVTAMLGLEEQITSRTNELLEARREAIRDEIGHIRCTNSPEDVNAVQRLKKLENDYNNLAWDKFEKIAREEFNLKKLQTGGSKKTSVKKR